MNKPNIETSLKSDRLHKFIARCGICSRRKAEELIQQGRVQVNRKLVCELGTKVNEEDEVRVDGNRISLPKLYYLVMNKPVGVVTTLSDPKRRPTVVKYLPDLGTDVKPIGRLDMDTEGLLLFTNDGDLITRLAHPKYGIEKTYIAVLQGEITQKAVDTLSKGIFLDNRKTKPAKVKVLHIEKRGQSTRIEITIHEGRYRQIRRMCEIVGFPVESLKRIKIGPLILKDLAPGMCRMLSKQEVEKFQKLAGLQ